MGPSNLFEVGFCVLSTCPHRFSLARPHFLVPPGVLSLSCMFPSPNLDSSVSSRNSGSLCWKTVFRNYHLSAMCAHCYWDVIPSRPHEHMELEILWMHISTLSPLLSLQSQEGGLSQIFTTRNVGGSLGKAHEMWSSHKFLPLTLAHVQSNYSIQSAFQCFCQLGASDSVKKISSAFQWKNPSP